MRIWISLALTGVLWAGEYSAARQVTAGNVTRLKQAWLYRSGEPLTPMPAGGRAPAFEATPVYFNGLLYLSTPYGKAVALEPATGKVRWEYQATLNPKGDFGDFASRGVSIWNDRSTKEARVFFATIDAQLIALDAATGKPAAGFTPVDLTKGLRRGPEYPGEYEQTSPPAILDDLVITGSAIADNSRLGAPTGEVRAWDVRTGRLVWTWHPLPAESRSGSANAWSLIRVDAARHLVFLPTGSASPDYFGGDRPGTNEHANSLVVLDGRTGERVWHFQTVHHDIWDYDVASPAELLTVRGRAAVAVGSKTGHLFLLDRETGRPLFPVEERAVPASDVEGEQAAATQPFPTLPPALSPQKMTYGDIVPGDEKACRERVAGLRNEGIFTPPSLRGSLIVPGNVGGLHWGGMAWSPEQNLLVAPSNNLPAVIRLIPRAGFAAERGRRLEGVEMTAQRGTAYGMSRQLLLAPSGLPCTAPPWGVLSAIDTRTGALRWQVPLGDMPGLEGRNLGSINLGGPLVTAGGVVFVGASLDAYLKAFELKTGRLLWRGALPASARSTPMSFVHEGRQYVVISAGGHERTMGKLDNAVVAFALDGQ